ncbi:hypothetical protein G3570_06365 [Balneolaceae bacterium YR4-1]|uniref:AsmA family protein n=1 Tax=Halalkalibaculum roseum TaxID=2709311 RepID=A0A6M1SVU6_9BACT|nr:AsmA family protein [Halalkalibaculum roseum]NGP76248.1 hypothetical protein [Halalkalibaculum roseum]
MSKSLKYSITGIVGIVLLAFVVLTFSLDYIVQSGIESTGSKMLKTEVTVENVSISLFSGSGTIEGLRVRNPEGFDSDYAMVMQRFEITMDVGTLLADTLVINRILIDEPALSVIQKVPENNLRMLMKNMEQSSEEESSSSGGLVIELLLVRNGRVSVTPNVGGEQAAVVNMGDIELENLGKSGNTSAFGVIRQITSRIINEALNSALSGQIEGLKNKAKDAVKDLFNQ